MINVLLRRLSLVCGLAVCLLASTGCSDPGTGPVANSGQHDAKDPEKDNVRQPGWKDMPSSVPKAPAQKEASSESAKVATTKKLTVGDPAPALTIEAWAHGGPVEEFDPKTVYVIEFWATWCAPCRASMPHLAGLQTEYGDKIQIVGVSDENEAIVGQFLSENVNSTQRTWKEILSYPLALDPSRSTYASYMEAAGQDGIPHAFIVGRTGKVEWMGHPMEMDDPLRHIVEGTWDLTAAQRAVALEQAKLDAAPVILKAMQSGDYPAAVAQVDALITQFPEHQDFHLVRLQFLIRGNLHDQANSAARTLIDQNVDQAETLHQIAWMLATGTTESGIDLNLAESAARRAVELSSEKNHDYLDTLARVRFRQGRIEEAAALQQKAIDVAPPDAVPQLQQTMKDYLPQNSNPVPPAGTEQGATPDPAQ